MEDDKKHAVLSASGSHKWLKCTPSARLEEKFPNKTSDYMEEGTLAHAIAEFKVNSYFNEALPKATYTRRINKFKKEKYFNAEMLAHTDTYLECIKGIAMESSTRPFVAVEQTIDYSDYAPDGFGTADCILISENTLHVIDFKYGKGVEVSATENPQMMLYALGAIKQFGFLYDIKTINMLIVQPRKDNISDFEMTKDELLNWGNICVKPQAQLAYMGLGNFVQGEHCRFCRAKGACEFRAKENMKVVEEIKEQKEQGLLTNIEIAEILNKTDGLTEWIKDISGQALDEILKGNCVPGYKAVEGRSNRKITDVDKAFEVLQNNDIEEALLYERKPIGLTDLEKVVGKKKLAETIGKYIEKPKGAPTLVKETDKREPYKIISAKEEFAEPIN